MLDKLELFDRALFLAINACHAPILDNVMYYISQIWVFAETKHRTGYEYPAGARNGPQSKFSSAGFAGRKVSSGSPLKPAEARICLKFSHFSALFYN